MSEPSTASSHNACFLGDTSVSHLPIVILYIHTWTIEFVNIQAGFHHTGRSDQSIHFIHSVKTHERHCQNTSVKSCRRPEGLALIKLHIKCKEIQRCRALHAHLGDHIVSIPIGIPSLRAIASSQKTIDLFKDWGSIQPVSTIYQIIHPVMEWRTDGLPKAP